MGWLLSSGGGGTVNSGWSVLSPTAYSAPVYAAPVYTSTVYAPASLFQAEPGPYGEGLYTPLNYPAMRFVGQDEQLPAVKAQGASNGLLLLALGLGVLLLLKS